MRFLWLVVAVPVVIWLEPYLAGFATGVIEAWREWRGRPDRTAVLEEAKMERLRQFEERDAWDLSTEELEEYRRLACDLLSGLQQRLLK